MITSNEEKIQFFQYLDFLPTPALIAKEYKNDKSGKTLFVNKAFIDMIGYKVDEIPNHLSFTMRAYPDLNYRREVKRDWLEQISRLGKDNCSLVQLCTKVRCKDQKYRWFEIRTELRNTIGDGIIIILFNNIDKAKNQVLEYQELSRKDPLTKLNNRRYMQQLLDQEKSHFESETNVSPFSLVMADIDFFKNINDTYGHNCGDMVIETVAKIMKHSTRKMDVVARWGGEEFLLLLPKTNVIEARIVVKKIMKKIHEQRFNWKEHSFNISLTYGITGFKKGEEIDETINRADHCLYQGKEMGRNCLVADNFFESWRS